jgi:hypothetical protein
VISPLLGLSIVPDCSFLSPASWATVLLSRTATAARSRRNTLEPPKERVVAAVQCEHVTAKNVSRLQCNAYWLRRTQNQTAPFTTDTLTEMRDVRSMYLVASQVEPAPVRQINSPRTRVTLPSSAFGDPGAASPSATVVVKSAPPLVRGGTSADNKRDVVRHSQVVQLGGKDA